MNKIISLVLIASVLLMTGCIEDNIAAWKNAHPGCEAVVIPTWTDKYVTTEHLDDSYMIKLGTINCYGNMSKMIASISINELIEKINDVESYKTEFVESVTDKVSITSPIIWRIDDDEIIYVEDNRLKWIYILSDGSVYGNTELINLNPMIDKSNLVIEKITKTVYITNNVDIITEDINIPETKTSIEKYQTIDFNFHNQ